MRNLLPVLVLLLLPASAAAQIGQPSSRTQADDGTPPATPAADDGAAAARPSRAPAAASDEAPAAREGSRATERSFAGNPNVLSYSPSIQYGTGGFRMAQATGMPTGNFGLSLFGEYSGGSSVVRENDSSRRFLGTLGLSWTPIQYFEAWVTLGARATTNSLGRPELIQAVGDLSLGLKGVYEIVPGLHAGLLVRLNAPSGSDQVGLDFGALGVDILALATADLRDLADVPVRVHFNAGYIVDRSSELFSRDLDRVERYGQGTYDYGRAHIGLGVDAPLPYVTPSLEWTLQVPNGAQCDSLNPQPCVSEGGFAAVPQFLTIGAKSAPLGQGLTLNTAFDLGLTTKESQGTPAIPAWNWVFGLSYDLDPTPVAAVEAPVEVPVAGIVSHVRGQIVDSTSGQPIEGARVSYVGTEFTDQVTAADGRFRSFDFAPGQEVTIEITHPNYGPRTLEVTISEDVREGQIQLEPAFTGARLSGPVSFAADPAQVDIVLRGAETYEFTLAPEDTAFEQDITPGEYQVFISAPGHVTITDTQTFAAGFVEFPIELRALPSDADLRLTMAEIEVLPSSPGVTFDESGALTPEGQSVLDEVAALMAADPSMRVRVRAHTDDTEDAEAEQALTEARAAAVVDYLTSQGVDSDRLRGEGAGALEPRVPNISERNRTLNNRVQFVVVR